MDIGRVSVGASPTIEWGPASSPVIWDGLVVLQVDTNDDSVLVALDVETGREVWMTRRDEPPSWSTPTVVTRAGRAELVVNGADYVRGYDPQTGEERWRLASGLPMATPTPIAAGELSFVASGGHGSPRPVAAIRPGASGDLSQKDGKDASASLAWHLTGRGPFLATPLAYRDLLYVLANNGVLDAYEVTSGKEVYRGRVPEIGSGFSASPVAADGRIYLANEDGSIVVVAAGREFGHIATNDMGDGHGHPRVVAGRDVRPRCEERLCHRHEAGGRAVMCLACRATRPMNWMTVKPSLFKDGRIDGITRGGRRNGRYPTLPPRALCSSSSCCTSQIKRLCTTGMSVAALPSWMCFGERHTSPLPPDA